MEFCSKWDQVQSSQNIQSQAVVKHVPFKSFLHLLQEKIAGGGGWLFERFDVCGLVTREERPAVVGRERGYWDMSRSKGVLMQS